MNGSAPLRHALLVAASLGASLLAQSPPSNGPRQVDARWHALVGATVVPEPGRKIDNATVVMRDGLIVDVAAGGAPPAGAHVWDCRGLWIYAGLIEPHLPLEAARLPNDGPGAHWNAEVQAQRSALTGTGVPDEQRRELRKLGFTAAAVAPGDGVFRGVGSVVLLDDPAEADGVPRRSIVRNPAYHAIAFARSRDGFPRSLMGSIALIRQTLLDAQWYAQSRAIYASEPARHEPPPANRALATLGDGSAGTPLLFDTEDELDALRAAAIAREFDRPCVVLGSGTEFRRLAALAEEKVPIIAPLVSVEAPAVETFDRADAVSLRALLTWEQQPTNLRRLVQAGIKTAVTSSKLKKRDEFFAAMRAAIAHGLLDRQALAMLTTQPAEILGVADKLGTVASGRLANLVVADGELFGERTRIRAVWIRGRRHEIEPGADDAIAGEWALRDAPFGATLKIARGKKVRVEVADAATDTQRKARKVTLRGNAVSFLIDSETPSGVISAHAELAADTLRGTATLPDGSQVVWSASRAAATGEPETDPKTDADAIADVPDILATPLGAFGMVRLPPAENLLIKNATVWLRDRVLEDGALLVRGGKIEWVGPSTDAPEPADTDRVLVARGKHVTAGLIDCHSHTGISRGINEGSQAVTSEVRIGDVIDPDDIGWYRQLAGGVTAVNQLHGSANPIGGQNSVVKIRWGALRPRDLRLDGAPGGIKFALGENVKQSSSRTPSDRYPQTRMGVEALIRDRFVAARDYARAREAASGRAGDLPIRRDLELDALVEILRGERLIHCHSYRQDEILMLCRVAHEFGFKIGTFQHVLEGYKVAEAIKEAALGASSFSDWWAYKYEVVDAIPENGAIMHDLGVVVSFNSDSGELARRLNTEAAKAVKYGGVPPAAALGFVTIAPAIQLGIADRVGSLEPGKDADFVIWSDDPLSTLARCEATFVDGRRYFSIERDAELRARASAERTRLLQKLFARKADSPDRERPDGDAQPRAAWGEWLWGSDVAQAGDCGCGDSAHVHDAHTGHSQGQAQGGKHR